MTRFIALLIVAGLAFALAGAALAVSHRREFKSDSSCTWGASSIVMENGRVVAGPDQTGCTP